MQTYSANIGKNVIFNLHCCRKNCYIREIKLSADVPLHLNSKIIISFLKYLSFKNSIYPTNNNCENKLNGELSSQILTIRIYECCQLKKNNLYCDCEKNTSQKTKQNLALFTSYIFVSFFIDKKINNH